MKYKNRTNHVLFLQLSFIGLQTGYQALLHAVGGEGGAADGVHLSIEGLVDGEAVPRSEEATVCHALHELGRLAVLKQDDVLDASLGVQGY